MGRIRSEIDVNGKSCSTLFDSGSRNSYVVESVARNLVSKELRREQTTALGGKVHRVRKTCLLEAEIQGHPIDLHARVLDEIGADEDGKPIEILFGALAMQEWGISLDLQAERLDLTHYTTDFVEF